MSWAARCLAPALTVGLLGCLAGPRHRVRAGHGVVDARTRVVTPSGAACSGCAPTLVDAPTGATPAPPAPPAPSMEGVALATTASADPQEPGTGAGPDPGTVTTDTLEYSTGVAPALVYGAMTGAQCEAELKKRGVPFTTVASALGVDHPIRLTGKLHGVDVHGLEKNTATSVYEIADCRLALALDDLAELLAEHDVVEAIHFSIYRPEKSKKPGQKPRSQHAGALAIDLGAMVKQDGTRLSVQLDWHGAIGAKSCGAGTGPWPKTKPGVELREILCAAYERHLFNVVLTPNFNKPHYNHFHLEVTRGVKWFLLR